MLYIKNIQIILGILFEYKIEILLVLVSIITFIIFFYKCFIIYNYIKNRNSNK